MATIDRDRLRHQLASHHDIRTDLIYLRACSVWVTANYYDMKIIPIPAVDGQDIMLRGLYLDALLMLYRKCFNNGQRSGLDRSKFEEVLGRWKDLHEHLIERATDLVAHAISASAMTTVSVHGGKAYPSTVRPGHNKSDFDNLIRMADVWLPFIDLEIGRLTEAFERLLSPEEDEGNVFFVAPFGSDIDIQALRTGRPAEKTQRQLNRRSRGSE
jgi:hypothetical protein